MTAPTFPEERTALAWRRTSVASMGTGALFLSHAVSNGWRGAVIAPVCAVIALLLLALMAFRRNRALLGEREYDGTPQIVLTTVVVVSVTVVAAVIGFTDPVR
ncbi:DUF202 domain-containing protein [Nocardia concava]|uniref:DUF202 domain-containing protein n=1 Tax=Nocardia concava TaxID=257281 RepID=UPI0009FD1D19|nr:DUF202 domain-containing protein [Nocardia concava]